MWPHYFYALYVAQDVVTSLIYRQSFQPMPSWVYNVKTKCYTNAVTELYCFTQGTGTIHRIHIKWQWQSESMTGMSEKLVRYSYHTCEKTIRTSLLLERYNDQRDWWFYANLLQMHGWIKVKVYIAP